MASRVSVFTSLNYIWVLLVLILTKLHFNRSQSFIGRVELVHNANPTEQTQKSCPIWPDSGWENGTLCRVRWGWHPVLVELKSPLTIRVELNLAQNPTKPFRVTPFFILKDQSCPLFDKDKRTSILTFFLSALKNSIC